MKIFIFTFTFLFHLAITQNDCQPTRCNPSGPVIRFPFRLKDRQPNHCGYPGFDLSCSETGTTEFNLQFPVTASTDNIVLPLNATVSVLRIDYKEQKILIVNVEAESCLPRQLVAVNSSPSHFDLETIGYGDGYTLFNCSSKTDYGYNVSCLSSKSYQVIAFASVFEITTLPPYSSCFKMYNISYIPETIFTGPGDEYVNRVYLHWSQPSCGKCEGIGKYCRLKKNSGFAEETECFSFEQGGEHGKGASRKSTPIAGITIGAVFFVFILIAIYRIFILIKRKKEDQRKIETVLVDFKNIRLRRYSYADIKRIASSFKEKLGEEVHGTVYIGKLVDGTRVAVKIFNGSEGEVEEFIKEVDTKGQLQHVNVLQLIGFCIEGCKRVLVYEFSTDDSLEMFISSESQKQILGQEKTLDVALGIAKGIDYLQQESSQRYVRLGISPHSIFLDHTLDPKISDFCLTKMFSDEQTVVSTDATSGIQDYIAPEFLSCNYENVSQKSDVYSFGMLLLDMMGRRKNFQGGDPKNGEVYFPEWMYDQLENGKATGIQMEREYDNKIVMKLTIIGLWCIQWYPSDRPSIKIAIQMLEGEKMPTMPPNPFTSIEARNTNATA